MKKLWKEFDAILVTKATVFVGLVTFASMANGMVVWVRIGAVAAAIVLAFTVPPRKSTKYKEMKK